jgi:hypothetical protein
MQLFRKGKKHRQFLTGLFPSSGDSYSMVLAYAFHCHGLYRL